MMVTFIAAVSDDGFIAQNGRIPWHLPRDFQHFRDYSAGKTLLVGRKTYEEMLGWFRGHFPFVITRQRDYAVPQGCAVASVKQALRLARERGTDELLVLGGGEIFAAAWPWAERLVITQVHTLLGEGTSFPTRNFSGWWEISSQYFPVDAAHAVAFTIKFLSPPNPLPHAT